MKYRFLFNIVFFIIIIFFWGCGSNSSKKLNVLILFSDQHNKKVMGFENHPDVLTPNLDKLANQSLIFDRAYCSVGVCTPSRSSFLTGLHPRTLGLLSNGGHSSVIDEAVSMASIFKANGYKTYAFGKRHVKGAIDEGWDIEKSHLCKESPGYSYTEWVEENGFGKEFAMDWAAEFGKGSSCSSYKDTLYPTADLGTRITNLPEEYTMEAFTTLLTKQMIEEQKNNDKPFFCWATFYRPHQPYNPLEKYLDIYDVSEWGKGRINGSGIKKPASFYEPAENLPPFLQAQRNGSNKVWNMDVAFKDEQIWRNYIGAYYALVTEIDDCIGEIIKSLNDAGITEETIVIYTSDHGDFVGNHGMVEKAAAGHNVYEDILNVPLIFKIPGYNFNGKRTAELVSLTDILPTLVDILDLELPELKHKFQGESLAELILKGESLNRKYLVSENWSQTTVITDKHKLGLMVDPTVVHPNWDYRDFGHMLFDIKNDPLEIKNEYDNPKYSEIINRLNNYYKEYVNSVPDIGKKEMINAALAKK